MVDRVPPTTLVEGASWRHQDGLTARRPREPVVVSPPPVRRLRDGGMDVICSASTLSHRLNCPD